MLAEEEQWGGKRKGKISSQFRVPSYNFIGKSLGAVVGYVTYYHRPSCYQDSDFKELNLAVIVELMN